MITASSRWTRFHSGKSAASRLLLQSESHFLANRNRARIEHLAGGESQAASGCSQRMPCAMVLFRLHFFQLRVPVQVERKMGLSQTLRGFCCSRGAPWELTR